MTADPTARPTPTRPAAHPGSRPSGSTRATWRSAGCAPGRRGWLLLAGLGVSAVISGDYAGWNFGLAEGGFGGLLVATVLMAVMYTPMVFGLAELGSALPTAGGGYTFARRALGPWGGYATGVAVLIEYEIAPAAIATFIGAVAADEWEGVWGGLPAERRAMRRNARLRGDPGHCPVAACR